MYRVLNLVKNDNSKRGQHTPPTHTHAHSHSHKHMEQGMHNCVQKAGGESEGESKSLLLKEVSFQVSLESV